MTVVPQVMPVHRLGNLALLRGEAGDVGGEDEDGRSRAITTPSMDVWVPVAGSWT